MLRTFAEVWGGEDFDKTPQLKRGLRALLYLLAYKQLTLAEARGLLGLPGARKDYSDITVGEALRSYLTQDIPNAAFREEWRDFLAFNRREFQEFFRSTLNRVQEFVSKTTMRTMLGQVEKAINFRTCMDEQSVVLIDLSDGDNFTGSTDGKMLGRLIMNQLWRQGWGRPEEIAKEKPFYVYIDECYWYLGDETTVILDQMRKFGVFVTAAHQRLEQLEMAGLNVKDALMSIAQVKVIFRTGVNDAKELAEQVFGTELDLQSVKHVFDKPVVVDQIPIWLLAENESWGEGASFGSSASDSETESTTDEEPERTTRSTTTGSTASEQHSTSHQQSSGRHQTMKSVFEKMPTTGYTLEELLHLAGNRLVKLPERHAIVRIPGRRSLRMSTLEEEPREATAEEGRYFRNQAAITSGCAVHREVAMRDVNMRLEILERAALEFAGVKQPSKQGSGKEKEDLPDDPEEYFT